MATIAVCNQKGGAGKTTLSLILADQLASSGQRVTVIDADPNANIAGWAAKRAATGRAMPFTVIERPTEGDMIGTITRSIDESDYIIIDLEGSASRMTSRALARAHLALIPFNQSPMDASLAANAVVLIGEESEALGRKIPFRLVRSRESAAVKSRSSKRIATAIHDAGLHMLHYGLVERAAYRDIFEFGATLAELGEGGDPTIVRAIQNARQVAQAVAEALNEEYPA